MLPEEPVRLVGATGHALLDNLLPPRHRQRLKARSLKSASKYIPNIGKHPATTQNYTLHIETTVMENGVAPRPQRSMQRR
ncbi:hypothetical protein [Streptomyces noursei]|uniref:hypothetical protein n=1 Tax=Streptomyces noursei TaxID=1971 RepID=UPI00196312FE|nr:hypothetical protein [Streptomyces noursei]QRX92125.1 hypothetical protein JNO44_15805 [Streptomyces noursei]